ncbi:MAG: AAA family ATPase, partial [Candidatus Hydrogenedentes bacterium]|nr:AAA family ATPase [Candidatus Hydrogenedentota bacterium]
MYEAFYGLREKPFNLTPDPKYLYLSDKHKEAFAHMLFGIKNRSGFVMVTGEIGTGKTTICRNLLNQMDSDTEIAFIFNPFLNPVELLRKINTEFGINTTAENLLGLTEELNIHLLNAGARGKSCVLVIDEAQNLDAKVLEQIRLLSNLETETSKLLQIVLIGQPELGEKLALHELRQLNQRITARYHLTALNQTETLQYIAYRIHVAGGRKGVNFTKGAVNLVYKFSRGTPRVINALCDRALLIGYTKEQRTITAAIIRQAAREIRGEKVAVKRPRERGAWRRFVPSPSLALAAILLLVLVRYLAIPIEQATRELGMFNKLISNEEPGAPGPPSPAPAQAQTPPVSAAAQREAPPAPDESLLARRVIDRLATVSRETRGTEDASFALDALAAADAGQARDAGLKLLMGKWGAPDGAAGPLTDNLEDLAGAAAAAGLAWEQLRPVTEQLLAINLPALVRLKLKDELRWFALVSAQDDKLTLALGPAETVSLPTLAFRDIYANEAL